MATKKMTDASWAQKVMSFIDSNEEGMIGRFGSKLHTDLKRTIRNMKRWIGDKEREIESVEIQLADKLVDGEAILETLKENYSNAFLEVDVKRLETSDKMDAYVHVFINGLQTKKNLILAQEQEIKDVEEAYKEKIERLNKSIEAKKEDIALLEEFLRNI